MIERSGRPASVTAVCEVVYVSDSGYYTIGEDNALMTEHNDRNSAEHIQRMNNLETVVRPMAATVKHYALLKKLVVLST